MESFFQNIILEREKVSLVCINTLTWIISKNIFFFYWLCSLSCPKQRISEKNYVIECLRILNEARFRSSDEVISAVNKRYPEDQASGASHKRQCLQTENGPSQTPEDKVVVLIYIPQQNVFSSFIFMHRLQRLQMTKNGSLIHHSQVG